MIVVLCPVLNRPQNAGPLARSLADATIVEHRLVFLVSPSDAPEYAACRETGAEVIVTDYLPDRADFARKINLGFRLTDEPFIFQAADDVEFQPGWDVEALAVIEATETGVCGTQDGANPGVKQGTHSTHSLIRRSYIDECGGSLDGPGIVFSEAYNHQWCDTELVELAKARGCWSFAPRARVLHRHPIWRTAPDDDTYRKGAAEARADRALYLERSRSWR